MTGSSSGGAPVTVGLYAANLHAAAQPDGAARIALLAEELGYDSLWVADHVVLPRPRTEQSPMGADEPILDPMVTLGYLASVTTRITLATGCVVLPQRNPLILAKQLASVDVLSRGRLVFGVSVGYLLPELRALGVDPVGRGRRMEEYLEAMLSLWYDEEPSYEGEHVGFRDVDAQPRPVQGRIPVAIGGHSAAAHRRAMKYGDEWYGFMLGLRATAEQLRGLEAAAEDVPRRKPLRISVTPARRLDPGVVRSFADLGVHRLVIVPPEALPLPELEQFIIANAPERLEATPADGAQPAAG